MSDSWHSYAHIFALGHSAIIELLLDPVVVQEKYDGSQFSFGKFDGVLKVRSRGKEFPIDAPEKMFQIAVDQVKDMDLHDGWTYRGEYFSKPKHNTLPYGRVPVRNIILFDINTDHEQFLSPAEVRVEAERLGMEAAITLFEGMLTDMPMLTEFLKRESTLGGSLVEGVVIKNYSRFGKDKHALMGKFVSEEFKETHKKEWKISNPGQGDVIQVLIGAYKSPARWAKVVQHLTEAGQLKGEPSDIGVLIKGIPEDTKVECKEEIMAELWKWAWPKISRGIVAGMPEWYKSKLAERQFEAPKEDAK